MPSRVRAKRSRSTPARVAWREPAVARRTAAKIGDSGSDDGECICNDGDANHGLI